MRKNIKNIKSDLKNILDKNRYEHTMGVAYTAVCLAMKYECDMEKAEEAGLLHDCAKCIPDEKKLKQCEKYNISITETEKSNPYLLHAKLGAFYAMHKYGITDREVINAILVHTTGAPDMTLLEKIIYVADYIEPHRKDAPHLAKIRRIAFEDLDMAVFMIMEDTLIYLKKKKGNIDHMTGKAYEYYKKYIGEREEEMQEYELVGQSNRHL